MDNGVILRAGKSVYISGPMTGHADHNFPSFFSAEATLRLEGYETVLNPARNFGGRVDMPRSAYMREDIQHLLRATDIYMLPGWENSSGARLEYMIAQELDLEVFFAPRATMGYGSDIIINTVEEGPLGQ